MEFDEAVAFVRSLPPANGTVPDATRLKLYALFKQATEGDVGGARPGFLSFEARAKYDARLEIAGKPADQARREYAALVSELRK